MGRYDSWYLRAVHPTVPIGVWIRHTFHECSGAVTGAHWITVFSPAGVRARKASFRFRPSADCDHFIGEAGDAAWDVRVRGLASAFEHLPARWMYRTPLPKTKPVSVYPLAAMEGSCSIAGQQLVLDGWSGMVGHNWGSEHAHRWIWIHAAGFEGAPDSWLDIILAKLKIGPFITPWIPNGAICLDGRRHRLGGMLKRAQVREDVEKAVVRLSGKGLDLSLEVDTPGRAAVVLWEYGDPRGSKHYVANCSIAGIRLTLRKDGTSAHYRNSHGTTYELGMREAPQGYEVQPYPDPQI